MDSLLRLAYFERPCNACGGSFRVTLHDILEEQQVHREWQPARVCSVCSFENRPVLSAIPEDLLQNLSEAWERVVEAATEAKLELRLG